MKKFSVTFDSFVVGIVEVVGDQGFYDHRGNADFSDYVVKREGAEVLRAAREHILYITISEVSTT